MNNIRQRLAVKLYGPVCCYAPQVVVSAVKMRGKCSVRYGLYFFYHVGYKICVFNNNLICCFLSKILKLLKHFLCCSEIKGRLIVGVGKALGCHYYFSVIGVLRVYKMDVACGHAKLIMAFGQTNNKPVAVHYVLHRVYFVNFRRVNHKLVVSKGLYLKIIVKINYLLYNLFRLILQYGPVKLSSLTGASKYKPLTPFQKTAFRYSWSSVKKLQMRLGYKLI